MGKLNIELLKKMRKRIAEIPESYDQEQYLTNTDRAPCGTAACLAGEAIICDQPTVKMGVERLRELDEEHYVPEEAADLLGLPRPRWGAYKNGFARDNVTARLFRCTSHDDTGAPLVTWPEPFKSQFARAKTYRGRAKAAVAYLDWIIKNKRVE